MLELTSLVSEMGKMNAKPASREQSLATAAEVAARIAGGFSVKTLANWRSEGKGPEYVKIGRLVRYEWPAVEAWLAARVQTGNA